MVFCYICVNHYKDVGDNTIYKWAGGNFCCYDRAFTLWIQGEEIPKLARTFAKGMKEFRRATDDIKREFEESTPEVMEDFKEIKNNLTKEVNEIKTNLTKDTDVIGKNLTKDANKIVKGVKKNMDLK